MLLGDIGGFTEIFYSISAIIVRLMTYQSSEKHLVKRLYKCKEDEVVKGSKLHTIKEYLKSLLPALCLKARCFKRNQRDSEYMNTR